MEPTRFTFKGTPVLLALNLHCHLRFDLRGQTETRPSNRRHLNRLDHPRMSVIQN